MIYVAVLLGGMLGLDARAGGDVDADFSALRSDAVVRLVELAEWCKSEKLYARRAAQFECILTLDPEHADARRQLGYRRRKDTWERSSSYRSPKDRNPEALEEFEARRGAAMGELVARGLALIDAAEGLPKARRDALLEEMLPLDPDHPELRRARGEVRRTESWILEDSARSIERRREALAFVTRTMEAIAPLAVDASALEADIGLRWTAVYETPHFRVLGTVPDEELQQAARAAECSYLLYRDWFPDQPQLSYDYTFYVVPRHQDVPAIVAQYPGCAVKANVIPRITGLPATGEVYVEYSSTRAQRVDNVAHMAAAQAFWAGVPTALPSPSRPKGRHQWANQATGHTFSVRILATRLSQRIGRVGTTSKKQDYSYLLRQQGSNWLELFTERMAEEPRPDLTAILGRDFSDLTAEDMMVAFAVWTFLIEARTEQVSPLLGRMATGRHPTMAVEDALGLSMDKLLDRVERWARETAEVPFHRGRDPAQGPGDAP